MNQWYPTTVLCFSEANQALVVAPVVTTNTEPLAQVSEGREDQTEPELAKIEDMVKTHMPI